MIDTPVARMRKEPLKTMKMEDIKIEFVDVCVVPTAEAYDIFEFDSDSGHGSPSSMPMEVSISAASPDGSSLSSSSSGTSEQSGSKPRKRAKLDHMSPEEKAQHRKMMNRISAQSARDRQKALMIRQDSTIKNLEANNDELKKKNQDLTTSNKDLVEENEKMKEENKRLSTLVVELEAKLKAAEEASASTREQFETDRGIELKEENDVNICCGSPSEPAVLRTIPLQKGSSESLQTLSLILVLWMSYLGISNRPKTFSALTLENMKQIFTESSRCQTLINLITPLQKQLLHKWLIRQGIQGLGEWTPD